MNVSGIWIYPIKSCRGISVPRARVLPQGLEGDRGYMLATPQGEAITQRERPELARVATAFTDRGVRLEAPGCEPLLLRPEDAARECTVQLWRTAVACRVMTEASRWFARFLGTEVQCVQQRQDLERPINPDYAGPGDHVNLADGYPLTLASEESLGDLNARLGEAGAAPVTMRNFRPNVVIRGVSKPFAEDDWPILRIGPTTFRMPKPSDRCVMVNVDPETGAVPTKEPLRTLAAFRARDQRVLFSVNLIPNLGSSEEAWLQVGDEVVALGISVAAG